MKVQIKNLRSIGNSNLIEIKPINLIVGKNSSGKSTILRTFPLIYQSITTNTASPILWYGDLVDFGDFSTAINRDCKNKEIIFIIEHDFSNESEPSESFSNPAQMLLDLEEIKIVNCKLVISIHNKDDKTSIKSIIYEINNYNLELDFINSTIKINDYKFKSNQHFQFNDLGGFFPFINFTVEMKKKSPAQRPVGMVMLRQLSEILDQKDFYDILQSTIKPLIIDESIIKKNLTNELSNLKKPSSRSNYNKLQDYLVLTYFESLINRVNIYFKAIFKNIFYIGPSRSSNVRYYRKQELSTDRLSHDGKNLAVFLNSLDDLQSKEFSEWVNTFFNFNVVTLIEGGHLSIRINNQNMADVGFGISQILPILAQIWLARKNSNGHPCIIAFEQPELHLHPAHQAIIANIICQEAKNSDGKTQFIIETHSEAIINKLGFLISKDKIDSNWVQVILVDQHAENNSEVKIIKFNNDGFLENWPHGFFDPGVEF